MVGQILKIQLIRSVFFRPNEVLSETVHVPPPSTSHCSESPAVYWLCWSINLGRLRDELRRWQLHPHCAVYHRSCLGPVPPMWPLAYRWADSWPWSVLGVHELWLRLRQWQGDAGFHEREGHLQLRASQRAAGADRLGAQAPPTGGAVWQQPELHQGLEGAHPARPKVRPRWQKKSPNVEKLLIACLTGKTELNLKFDSLLNILDFCWLLCQTTFFKN